MGRLTSTAQQQHLNVDLRPAGVTVPLSSRDVSLARLISAAARDLDILTDPTAVQLINITLDALVGTDVLPFWRALLGYRQIGDDYLGDPLPDTLVLVDDLDAGAIRDPGRDDLMKHYGSAPKMPSAVLR
ncbi:hypothetical protein [Actinoplanes sp. NPDC049316]|uniref:hypothetical protein n=1 Tax=Actinoplanes sp. NPDC049316 TaxID=3154727 RepID=UPI0034267726